MFVYFFRHCFDLFTEYIYMTMILNLYSSFGKKKQPAVLYI